MNTVSKIFIPVAGVLAIAGGYFAYKYTNPSPSTPVAHSDTTSIPIAATASPAAINPDTITQALLDQGTAESQGVADAPTPAPADEQAAVGADSSTEQSLQVSPSL